MARMKRIDGESPASDFEENNADNYVARAVAFGKRRGYQPGEWPIIRSGDHEWQEWFAYFECIGHPFAKPNSFASRRGVMTVPSRTPDEFEPGWRSRETTPFKSDKIERYVKPLEMLTPEEREASRERVAKMLERVKREIAQSALNADAKRNNYKRRYSEAAE